MSDEEDFKPTSLAAVFGEADDAPKEPTVENPDEQRAEPEEPKPEEAKADTGEQQADSDKAEPEKEPDQAESFAQLREQVKKYQARVKELETTQTEQKKRPDVFEDPDGAFRHVEEQVSQKMLAMSEEMARAQYPDFDEKVDRFLSEAEKNPALAAEVKAAAHPALKAYQLGEKYLTQDEIGDPKAFKEKTRAELREEIRKELEAEMNEKSSEKKKLKESLPDDLTSERNAGKRSGPVWTGPTPLEEVLPS